MNNEVKLTFFDGPHQASATITKHRKYVVGSGSGAQLQLSPGNLSISSRHFAIDFKPSGCSIADLGSANGTFVNGRKIAEAELRDGDTIQVGTIKIQVSLERKWQVPEAGEILELEQIAAERVDKQSPGMVV
jgi:predicted component of type VI protein secretion system